MQDVYQIMMTGGLLISIVSLIAWWSIFKKAGYKGWYAIIPLFNVYIFCKLTLGSGWLVLTMLIPIFNIFMLIYILFRLSVVFQHGLLFTLGLIFFYPIFILILAFGNSKYHGSAACYF